MGEKTVKEKSIRDAYQVRMYRVPISSTIHTVWWLDEKHRHRHGQNDQPRK